LHNGFNLNTPLEAILRHFSCTDKDEEK